MLLKSVHVTHFKCVKDSTKFTVDPKATCLVGKNESGKTALLQAIEKINPLAGRSGKFDVLDYPANEVTEYKQRAAKQPDDAISTVWELEPDDVKAVEDLFGKGVVTSREFTITKGYYGSSKWDVEYDEKLAFDNLLTSHDLHNEEREALHAAGSLENAFDLIGSKPTAPDDKGTDIRSTREQSLYERIERQFPEKSFWEALTTLLEQRLPKIVYFSEYLRMPGQVSLDDLKQRIAKNNLRDGHRVFLALLTMIDRQPNDLENINEFERLQRELEGASSGLTRQIFKYWSQNRHLRVQFRFDHGSPGDSAPFNAGYVMRTRIENTRHGATTSFDERSTGFVWFFSFLVWFGQVQKHYGDNLLLLLDEPGMGLHAKAQSDLLRYIEEKLAENFQVIYTTHSPFMISPTNLLRARTVEDVFISGEQGDGEDQELGTKVGDQVLSTDKDTLFPLQACLGYEITQTLFIGENALLVEGPAEILYLPWFSRKLKALGRTGLDSRWTLTPCGGVDKIPAFLSLFAGQKLHIATLLDYATGQKGKVETLRKNQLLAGGHVLTAEQYTGQAEADIEDVIGRTAYVDLINKCYDLRGQSAIPTVKPASAPMRVVKEVEDHFKTVATAGPEFDHYRPAEFLTQQGTDLALTGLDVALERFEKLFIDLNKMLPSNANAPSGAVHRIDYDAASNKQSAAVSRKETQATK